MVACLSLRISLATILALASTRAGEERELIRDNHFQRGLILWKAEPGKHVRYGELPGVDSGASPVWGLAQWSSKFPLAQTNLIGNAGGALVYSNAAKTVTLGAPGTTSADIALAANAGVEYGSRARQSAKEPWVHLLVEQKFDSPAPLRDMTAAKLQVEARLLLSRLVHEEDHTPNLHAAQFQISFTVQNRNRQSPGFGDLLWFGVPIYDNRHRFIPEFKAQDFGGTAKFIFTPAGKAFTSASAHDGEWVVIEKDLLPLMREALETAWARGFLKNSTNRADYHLGGMNMGWELPGIFDVEMQVRNLSLKILSGNQASERPPP